MAEGSPLEYVSVPPSSDTGQSPALILVHGRGSHERDLVPLTEGFPDDLHVLSVRAPDRLGPGYTWYDLDLSAGGLHQSQPDSADYEQSLSLLATFQSYAIDTYDLDPDRIGLLGFSQGAILSFGALATRPESIAWAIALHGYLPARYDEADFSDATETPVFIGAGEQDEIIPVTRAADAADTLEAASVPVTFNRYPVGHGTTPDEVADVTAWLDSVLDNSNIV